MPDPREFPRSKGRGSIEGIESIAAQVFETYDSQLAAYLSLLQYDGPSLDRRGRNVVFVFPTVVQEDVVAYSSGTSVYISPKALFARHGALVHEARRFLLDMAPITDGH